ncbi:MAG: hypothetical protein PVJ27_10060 [Candidatus Brocadiaceae bacterium]
MAAVRRTSESGIVVALVVFVILAFAGVGCGIWFYQQLSLAKQTIAATQDSFESTVHAVFRENNWELPTQEPPELGVVYAAESFERTAAKVREAAEFENVVMPTLGWESVAGMQQALQSSTAQKELEAQGEATFNQFSGLLEFYERRYDSLNSTVAELRSKNGDLTERLESTKADLVKTQEEMGEKLNQATENFKSELGTLRSDYNELLAQYEEQQKTAMEWQQKYQDELNQRRQQVSELKDQVETWETRYWNEVRGPAEEELLQPLGKVISVDTENDFVYIEGGADLGFREKEVYVVFGRTPGGEDRRKGVITISEVRDSVSRASVTQEEEFIVEGDYFVSFELWDRFHGG